MRFINTLCFIFICQIVWIDLSVAQQPNPFGAQAPLDVSKKRTPIPLSTEKAVKVIYGSATWNKDPKAIDASSIILREGKTDRLVQVYLKETEPDSALFSGLYSVRWENVERLSPEIYVVPPELLGENSELKEFKSLIANKKISRKPFIFRKENQQQVIEIYDTAEQARIAYQAFKAERAALSLANRKIVPDSTVDADQLALSAERRRANAKAQQERIRLEQIEVQKRISRLREFTKFTRAERTRRKEEAARLASLAMEDYRKGHFSDAERNSSKSLETDPQNTAFYFQYGVTLYKLEQANHAIVFLNMAESTPQIETEKYYYLGLAYLKIEDYSGALPYFTQAAQTKHPEISPSAEFYRGMILIEQKKYDEATSSFQKVLDTSKDPKLDEKAEQMIEKIHYLRQFEKEKNKRWSASALIGEMYDSNVLLINDTSTSGGATELIGYRTLVAGGFKYRPVYDEKKEFAVTFDALHIYTIDSNFKQRASLRLADPTLLTITTPYTIKSVLWGRGNKVDIRPGYETLMSSQEDDTQKIILHSGFVAVDDVMILNERNLVTAKFELRFDSSQLRSSVGDADASAFKTKILLGHLRFMNTDRTKMLMSDFGLTRNQANGKDVLYNRLDLSVGYVAPWLWDVTYNAKLAYYYLSYPDRADGRADHDLGFTLAGSRKINAALTGGLTGIYTRNISNVTAYDYAKYTILATVAANWDF